jgi:hypothetical protein
MRRQGVLSLLVASCLMGTALCACPPAGFDSVANFDLVKYMTGPWYSQQQVREQLCSAATWGGIAGTHVFPEQLSLILRRLHIIYVKCNL